MSQLTEEMDIAAPVENQEELQLAKMRHSAAHVMAEAVLERFPGAKLGIGPAIENGFYYDFDLPRPLTPEDLESIEQRMAEIRKGAYPFVRDEISREAALAYFADQPYKVEIINDLPEDAVISRYTQDTFTDLCRGPHVENTSRIGKFKLLNVAGAYWRGSEKRPMLQRIYGTAWPTQEDLDNHLHRLEEAQRRDHRRLAKELDLFSIDEEIGPGLILWHPKGAIIRYQIEQFVTNELLKRGYQLVYTPHIASEKIYRTSGHLATYGENMFPPMEVEGAPYYVKPMNCPGHIKIYDSQIRSYRDLPMRLAEMGTVYRYERSGTLHGTLRVRGFTQDDAHIFVRPDQIVEEVKNTLDLAMHLARIFGYEYKIFLATRPEKSIGSEEQWTHATEALAQALREMGLKYEIDEGAGAFYGPKIDIKFLDSLGREWTGPTVQVDWNLPERFDLTYINEEGKRERPVMVHRAVLGSMERFVGGLIEHFAGAFPVWLAPVQAEVIPIADRHLAYAEEVAGKLRAAGLRVQVNSSGDRMQAKIRRAQLEHIPYMLVVGDKEVEAGAVSVRLRTNENLGQMPVDEFIAMAREITDTKSLDLVPAKRG
ncbi:threonine--tRNA ligase [Nitrolancea hollandica]|uniref:Threonine--tRNA ligase n=1 Tax=Nitrolancea hollandica Lb TaxID=1129897 RepID=I4EGH1_9BACT|nr:threonine--tRNA ligase [Nitrolancea hollandica]CCF83783.1 Threonyl-tRNA synthetase [Nitrolancea hollandica Lb]